jgi:cysteinyl-tRNA synthetase
MRDRGTPLSIFNSLTRRQEEFQPLVGDSVGMYSCGPTVYDYPHIGNLRAYIASDTVHRALLWKGYGVRKVINITDVGHLVADADTGEDKLEREARLTTQSVYDLARRYEEAFHEDLRRLRIIPADDYPRATAYITEMIEFASVLERKGAAYRLDGGLYFDTATSRDYGRLALMKPSEQREGARIEAVSGKRNKTDFAVWRTEAPGEQRLMRWDSPWGWGAPGWHLECSVMSMILLGEHFDLHTGGIDHRELHHVNEIAQSEAYLDDGREWVHFWLHNEFLNIKHAKMAKSEGTGLRLTDLVEDGFDPAAYRLASVGGHYRSQMEFSREGLESSATALRRLRNRAEGVAVAKVSTYADAVEAVRSDAGLDAIQRMDRAIADDLNTARVLAVLQESSQDPAVPAEDRAVLFASADHLLGLGLDEPPPPRAADSAFEAEILDQLARRDEARANREWAAADRIRDELEARGVRIMDTPDGTQWELS